MINFPPLFFSFIPSKMKTSKMTLKYENGPPQGNGSYLYHTVSTSDCCLVLNLPSCDSVQIAWYKGAEKYALKEFTPLQVDSLCLEPGHEFADCNTPAVVQQAHSLLKQKNDSQLLLLMTNFYNSAQRL